MQGPTLQLALGFSQYSVYQPPREEASKHRLSTDGNRHHSIDKQVNWPGAC